jgi:hypothetical protein
MHDDTACVWEDVPDLAGLYKGGKYTLPAVLKRYSPSQHLIPFIADLHDLRRYTLAPKL